MRLWKKLSSALLAGVLLTTTMPTAQVGAQDIKENESATEQVQNENQDQEQKEVSENEEEEKQDENIDTEFKNQINENDNEEEKKEDEKKDLDDSEIDLENPDTENIENGEETKETEEGITPFSMQPLEEVKAYIVLEEQEDKQMLLSDFLKRLVDTNGNPISISESEKIIWTYTRDNNDNVIQDEYHEIQRDEMIDLSPISNNPDTFVMELIVGDGNQLNPDNIRYIIRVYLVDAQMDQISIELYRQDDGVREKVKPIKEETTSAKINIWGIEWEPINHNFTVSDHKKGQQYYVGINSTLDEHPYINVNVYTLADYIIKNNPFAGYIPDSITQSILNQDMSVMNAGYFATNGLDIPDGSVGDNYFVMEYSDPSGEVFFDEILSLTVTATKMSGFEVESFYEKDGKREKANVSYSEKLLYGESFEDLNIDISEIQNSEKCIFHTVVLKPGLLANEEYYYALNAKSSVWENANDHVVKAVKGLYTTLEETAGQIDIKEQLIPSDRTGEYGYKANYSGDYGKEKGFNFFTVFFDDGTRFNFAVIFEEYFQEADPDYIQSYNKAPVVGAKDPWFNLTGLKLDDRELDTYVIENGKNINMDTYYGYGYQTILVNENLTDEELSRLKPIFKVGNENRVKIRTLNSQKELVSGEDEVDFSKPVQLVALLDDKTPINYQVRVVSKNKSGPKLYVYDDYTEENVEANEFNRYREVFLDEYFEYKHDILIANIGDEPLEDLKVTLDATNVKLDDYWTVGGENNNSLAPFENTKDHSQYSQLQNIAKIRLLPANKEGGEIKGTLTISAKGQKDVVIHLSGRARQPKIVTNEFEHAVKYVPYSYMVATNNMYDWNEVTFKILDGKLPEGMTLNEGTGEIYGAPLNAGQYHFTLQASYSQDKYFEPSTKEYTITVLENENETVFNTSDEGYSIIPEEDGIYGYIGEQVAPFDFVLTTLDEDQTLISEGEIGEFAKLWLNGVELVEGVDYVKEPGSTRITVRSKTFKDRSKDGRNTISAEFNENSKRGENLKRTSQNYRVELKHTQPDPTLQPEPENPEENKPNNPSSGNNNGITNQPSNPGNQNNSGSSNNSGASKNNTNTSVIQRNPLSNSPIQTNNASGETIENLVTMIAIIQDQNGEPISNQMIEIHSDPKIATTDHLGNAQFNSLEFGKHTIYLKDGNGNVIVSKEFELIPGSGDNLSIEEDRVTVSPGQSFSLTMVWDGTTLTFKTVKLLSSPNTNSHTYIYLWSSICLTILLSLIGLYLISLKKKLLV